MFNEIERNEINKLKSDIEASENILKAEQYYFEQKIKNGLGEEINYTLSNSGINNIRENKPNIITRLKRIFTKK